MRTLHVIRAPNGRSVRLTENDGELRIAVDASDTHAVSASVTAGDLAALAAAAEDYRDIDPDPEGPPATPPGADLND